MATHDNDDYYHKLLPCYMTILCIYLFIHSEQFQLQGFRLYEMIQELALAV